MEKKIQRGRHRIDVENALIRRREKQFNYDKLWNGTSQYFQHWQKSNSKYEQWTSPRYYEDSNKQMDEMKEKKEKEEKLEIRREKLRKLLEDEQRSLEVELMIYKNKTHFEKSSQVRSDDIPTEILKEINVGIKEREEERRRHEAEMKLYHQWRINNPIVKKYENQFRSRDLKFSWLDQQIEKRMQKEKEEEENRRIIKEQEEQIKKEKQQEQAFKRYLEEKQQQLRKQLDEQIEELKQRRSLADNFKKEEEEELKKQSTLAALEDMKAEEERKRANKECALFNIQLHKMKLKQKAIDIQNNLKQDELMIAKLKEMQLENILSDEMKKNEIKQGLHEFLNIIKQQKELEKQRQRHMEFLFDSEARAVFERQSEIWRQEEDARKQLFQYVMETVKKQIEDNVLRNKEKQKQILLEQEELTNKIEEYEKELQQLKKEEEQRKIKNKKSLDDEIKVKNARKAIDENIKLKEIMDELETIRKEEERLKKEIEKMQQSEKNSRYKRSNRL